MMLDKRADRPRPALAELHRIAFIRYLDFERKRKLPNNVYYVDLDRSSPVFPLGPDEWLLFKKLPDYAPRTKRKTIDGDVIQLPFPESDEDQQQAL